MTKDFDRKVNNNSTAERQVPHNLDAEAALLGAILINNEAADKVSSFLLPEHFWDAIHRSIYATAMKLISDGKKADAITLKPYFSNVEPITKDLQVWQYLGNLVANATTVISAADYGRTIYDLAMRRSLILIGEDMVNQAYDSPVDFTPVEQIEDAEQRLYSLVDRGALSTNKPMRSIVDGIYARAHRAYEEGGVAAGMTTGLKDLDNALGGLQPGCLYIVAGRPSMGKTALAMGIARAAAKRSLEPPEEPKEGKKSTRPYGAAVQVFSLEMTDDQLGTRLLSTNAEIATRQIKTGGMSAKDMQRLTDARGAIGSLPIWIDQTAGLKIGQLYTRARRAKRQHGIGLVIVDYLQLMQGSGRSDNRVQDLTVITNGLKTMAKELDVPVVALSQLSRNVENREDKRPHLADLRESGSIEQDADVVMFVYRDEYYVERAKPQSDLKNYSDALLEWQARLAACQNKAELILGKNREGPTSTVNVAYHGSYARFSDLAEDR